MIFRNLLGTGTQVDIHYQIQPREISKTAEEVVTFFAIREPGGALGVVNSHGYFRYIYTT